VLGAVVRARSLLIVLTFCPGAVTCRSEKFAISIMLGKICDFDHAFCFERFRPFLRVQLTTRNALWAWSKTKQIGETALKKAIK
jgi:hypothetical protein